MQLFKILVKYFLEKSGVCAKSNLPMSAIDVFGKRPFSDQERREIAYVLSCRLRPEHTTNRKGMGGSGDLTYIESSMAIRLANAIFGWSGWSDSVKIITTDYTEKDSSGKWSVGCTAVMRVELRDGTHHEDVGIGTGKHSNRGLAIEGAKKEAVSDARKRTFRLFGDAMGNCLYDKEVCKLLMAIKKGNAPAVAEEDPDFLPLDIKEAAREGVSRLVHPGKRAREEAVPVKKEDRGSDEAENGGEEREDVAGSESQRMDKRRRGEGDTPPMDSLFEGMSASEVAKLLTTI